MPIADRRIPKAANEAHRIVVVGGGVAGLALATRLAQTLGRDRRANVVLVDQAPAHFWKPRLHEVAAGQVDPAAHQIQYAAHAQQYGFDFEQGGLVALDRARRTITIDATRTSDGGEILPVRDIAFDTLVLAMGSVTNYFGVPGAAEHALPLESVGQAETFRRRLLAACTRTNHARRMHPDAPLAPVTINIVGAGATGVELAAALRAAAHLMARHGFAALDPKRDFHLRLIEGGARVLPALAEPVSARAQRMLAELGIDVLTNAQVTAVREDAVTTANGATLAGDLTIWTAGVSGPDVLRTLDGLAVTRNGQVRVTNTLQTATDPNIFALGDCAACPVAPDAERFLAPRAQVAHQQAAFLARAIRQRVSGHPLPSFTFRDAGTLVGFGDEGTLGNVSGGIFGPSLFVDGWIATVLYRLIYRRHVMTLTGFARMAIDAMSQWLRRLAHPLIRLH